MATSKSTAVTTPLETGLVDYGDLGKAILNGLTRETSRVWTESYQSMASSRSEEMAQSLRNTFAGLKDSFQRVNRRNVQVAEQSDAIIFACPPGATKTVLSESGMREAVQQKIDINIAAGVTRHQIETIVYGDPVTEENATDRAKVVDSSFNRIGKITHILASAMDASSVMCGSAPAFTALFCDAMIDGAVASGLNRKQAESMVALAVEHRRAPGKREATG
ncbi:hypothetical protein DL768_011073 [Monosporascus sp. mg162]|nr:hypothetical protein DL768_011073 [Monosporascus sp. mg162]